MNCFRSITFISVQKLMMVELFRNNMFGAGSGAFFQVCRSWMVRSISPVLCIVVVIQSSDIQVGRKSASSHVGSRTNSQSIAEVVKVRITGMFVIKSAIFPTLR